jgi:choline dehydrogenase-like flavoprotein
VTLDPKVKDANGVPVAHLHVDDHPNDLAMRKHAHQQATKLYEAVGAKRVITGNSTPSAHNMGTARMSADTRNGVTNAWGQTHDIRNLFVSDGSLLSSSGSANPTLTIVALVLRQADYIAHEMTARNI